MSNSVLSEYVVEYFYSLCKYRRLETCFYSRTYWRNGAAVVIKANNFISSILPNECKTRKEDYFSKTEQSAGRMLHSSLDESLCIFKVLIFLYKPDQGNTALQLHCKETIYFFCCPRNKNYRNQKTQVLRQNC